MFSKKRKFISFLVLILVLSSCSHYQKVLKNPDVKAKYDLAEKYYDAEDYKRANRLFEQIAPKYVGKPQGERVMFFFANSYFKQKDYNMSGYQFERFIKSYPNSEKVPEAAFLGARSYFELSPPHSLDQTDTDKALVKLQNFINAYPDSEFFDEANAMAKELTTKKERKAFEIGKQFNKLGHFDYTFLTPAMAAFDNFISDYPGSTYREDALYLKFESATEFALYSFSRLKPERMENARTAYNTLLRQFPETKYADDAAKLLKKIEKDLDGTITNEVKETK
ncbi:MAG: outer membrane protein assembly factor BamD [Maribacter sp.]|nr:outer membrane protein assembly factor BamD [Maribacter sp.]